MFKESDIKIEIDFLEKYLERVSAELEQLKKLVPEGCRLRAAKHGAGYQYFIRERGCEINGKYIKKKNRNIAVTLAQIEYDELLLTALQETLEGIKKYKTTLVNDPFISAFEKLTLGKRELVTPPFISDESYILNWKNQQYERLEFKEDFPEYYTRQGLRVRSKSEVIIADMLDEFEIPFLYEKPLCFNSITLHPDFTLLNIKERRELYWEHFGIMDDMDYRNNAFLKIRNYESNGLYQSTSLIWTFETGKYPINTKVIRKMIKKLKKELGYG